MKNVDCWFILIGLLYGAFGIWVGINERFDQAHLHAHTNLVGWASMVLFELLYRAFPALAENQLAAVHFALYNLGAVVFLIGIPLAQAHQTVVLAADGSLLVLVGILTFIANYYLNEFSQPTASALEKA
jgi:cbb3-type cytochrome oxidase subunit 1